MVQILANFGTIKSQKSKVKIKGSGVIAK